MALCPSPGAQDMSPGKGDGALGGGDDTCVGAYGRLLAAGLTGVAHQPNRAWPEGILR
jgi:hypothetical protein